jgi:hypothetical protein
MVARHGLHAKREHCHNEVEVKTKGEMRMSLSSEEKALLVALENRLGSYGAVAAGIITAASGGLKPLEAAVVTAVGGVWRAVVAYVESVKKAA